MSGNMNRPYAAQALSILALSTIICLVSCNYTRRSGPNAKSATGGSVPQRLASKSNEELERSEVVMKSLVLAQNLMTGEEAFDGTFFPPATTKVLRVGPGDALVVRVRRGFLSGGAKDWPYVFSGEESQPLVFGERDANNCIELMLGRGRNAEVIGFSPFRNLDEGQFAAICERYWSPKILTIYFDESIRGKPRRISTLQPLEGFTHLKALKLWRCRNIADISSLASLVELRFLTLRECSGTSNLEPLSTLKNLNYLDLMRCKDVEDLRPLARLKELEYLCVAGCPRVKEIGVLGNMPKLRELDIRGCYFITEEQIGEFEKTNPQCKVRY